MTIDEFLERFAADHAADFHVLDGGDIRHKDTCLCPIEAMAGHTGSDDEWWSAIKAAKKLGLGESPAMMIVSAADAMDPVGEVLEVRAKLIAAIEAAQSAQGETQ